ncbi:MAG: sugar ABC transporter substrate-binding protein, partial [Spirochaetae bacterium HGW-Spirochaetae-9]
MKKALGVLMILVILGSGVLFAAGQKESGLIKVGIVNLPPEESGYRQANVED